MPKGYEESVKKTKELLNNMRESLLKENNIIYHKFNKVAWGIIASGVLLGLTVTVIPSDK